MKLIIDLKYCYGIKALQHEFDFSTGRAFLIYAPNGSMKTSLAKVFRDISEGKKPTDVIFPHRPSYYSVTNNSNMPLDQEHLFVVNPYEEEFSSQKIATLLVNAELKRKYEAIHAAIDKSKVELFAGTGKTSGLKKNAEQDFLLAFNTRPGDIYALLEKFEADVNSNPTYDFSDIAYKEIFDQKVLEFLASAVISTQLSEYVAKYNELIGNSFYFRKGIFTHNNASTVSKTLKDNGFFKANHSVNLTDKTSKKKEVLSQAEFETVITGEKERIINDPDLLKRFDAFDKAIAVNQGLRDFRTYIEEHPNLLPELTDLNSLKNKMWISY